MRHLVKNLNSWVLENNGNYITISKIYNIITNGNCSVTHILIFLTIGLSVFLTPMLSHIPMPVLFGVFLYMGFSSLKGLQFFDRILIMFMPNKYQPDYMFLRQVRLFCGQFNGHETTFSCRFQSKKYTSSPLSN